MRTPSLLRTLPGRVANTAPEARARTRPGSHRGGPVQHQPAPPAIQRLARARVRDRGGPQRGHPINDRHLATPPAREDRGAVTDRPPHDPTDSPARVRTDREIAGATRVCARDARPARRPPHDSQPGRSFRGRSPVDRRNPRPGGATRRCPPRSHYRSSSDLPPLPGSSACLAGRVCAASSLAR
jgi:hypothetical protein